MDDISKYHDGNIDLRKRLYIIINNTKKTFQYGYGLGYGGKYIGERVIWLIDDCYKFGYKAV